MRIGHRASSWAALVPLLVVLCGLMALGGCARRHDIAVELEIEIAQYRKDPSDALAARIDASFAHLDAEVAEIRADAATKAGEAKDATLARADALAQRGSDLRKSYYETRVDVAAQAAKGAVKQFGASVGKAIEDAGAKMKNSLGGDGNSDKKE